jgi:pilus assembly protein Flp/PilA
MEMEIKAITRALQAFSKDEDGAQVIEYALIIAVVSIFLVIALQGLSTGGYFASFVNRLVACLTGTTTSSCA